MGREKFSGESFSPLTNARPAPSSKTLCLIPVHPRSRIAIYYSDASFVHPAGWGIRARGRAFLQWTHPPLFRRKNMNNLFRSLPSVDACLSGLENRAPVLYATTPAHCSVAHQRLSGRARRDIKEGRLTDSDSSAWTPCSRLARRLRGEKRPHRAAACSTPPGSSSIPIWAARPRGRGRERHPQGLPGVLQP